MADGYIDIQTRADGDVDQLRERAIDALRAGIFGYQTYEGDVEYRLLDATAEMAAARELLLVDVSREVFRTFGREIIRLAPIDAAAATGFTTWTAADDATPPFVIPAGTQVAIGGHLFAVATETTIAENERSVTGVQVTAVEEGAQASGLTGPVDLQDALVWRPTIVLEGPTSGGQDAEPDDVYEDRLARRIRHLGRPTLPADFTERARAIPGVGRAVTLDMYEPGVNEQQTVTVTDADGGTFTLTFDGQTTSGIGHDATADDVQTALEALSNIGVGDVSCTGGPLDTAPVLVEFTGALKTSDVAEMTADGGSLTGGGAAVGVTTTRAGVAPDTDAARTVTIAVADEAGQAVSSGIRQAVKDAIDAERETTWQTFVIDPTYTTIDVAAKVTVWDGWDVADTLARAEAALAAWLSPATWGAPPGGETPAWHDEPVALRTEAVETLGNVDGVRHVILADLKLNGAAADVTLEGPAGLPLAGTITVTEAS